MQLTIVSFRRGERKTSISTYAPSSPRLAKLIKKKKRKIGDFFLAISDARGDIFRNSVRLQNRARLCGEIVSLSYEVSRLKDHDNVTRNVAQSSSQGRFLHYKYIKQLCQREQLGRTSRVLTHEQFSIEREIGEKIIHAYKLFAIKQRDVFPKQHLTNSEFYLMYIKYKVKN